MKVTDGMAAAQHNTILARMEECLLIDPAKLLVEDWELLDADFDKLTCGPTSEQIIMVGRNGPSAGHGRSRCQGILPLPPLAVLLWPPTLDEYRI